MGVVAGHHDAAGHNGNLDVGHGQSLTERAGSQRFETSSWEQEAPSPARACTLSAAVANDQ
jgi:hypothetical protein